MTCPQCGSEPDRIAGAVSELIWSAALARVARRVRPAVFWACAVCEWCAEVWIAPEPTAHP